MGHTAEEKIKILYEDSLADIRELTSRMESMTTAVVAAAESVNNMKIGLQGQNEKLLMDRIAEITKAVQSLNNNEIALTTAAASAARQVLSESAAQIEMLVKQQKDALGWINRAAEFYGNLPAQGEVGSWLHTITGGIIGAIVVGLIIKLI